MRARGVVTLTRLLRSIAPQLKAAQQAQQQHQQQQQQRPLIVEVTTSTTAKSAAETAAAAATLATVDKFMDTYVDMIQVMRMLSLQQQRNVYTCCVHPELVILCCTALTRDALRKRSGIARSRWHMRTTVDSKVSSY
jgi:hypothetical protein